MQEEGLILALCPAIQSSQNFLDGGQVGAIPQRVSCTPLWKRDFARVYFGCP